MHPPAPLAATRLGSILLISAFESSVGCQVGRAGCHWQSYSCTCLSDSLQSAVYRWNCRPENQCLTFSGARCLYFRGSLEIPDFSYMPDAMARRPI